VSLGWSEEGRVCVAHYKDDVEVVRDRLSRKLEELLKLREERRRRKREIERKYEEEERRRKLRSKISLNIDDGGYSHEFGFGL